MDSAALHIVTIRSHFGLFLSLNREAEKGDTTLPGLISSDCYGESGCCYLMGVGQRISGTQRIP